MVKRTNMLCHADLVLFDSRGIGSDQGVIGVVTNPHPFPYHATVMFFHGDSTAVLRSRLTALNRELTVEELLIAHPDFLAQLTEKTG